MKLNLEKRTIIMISVFGALTIAIVVGVIIPTIRSIQNSVDQTQALRTYLEKRYARIANLRTSVKKINEMRDEVAVFPNHLFKHGQELELITTLEGMAAKNNVTQKVTNSNLDQATNNRLTVSVTISGDLFSALRYLADLEALPYFLNVTELRLTSAANRLNQGGPGAPVSLNLDLSLYVN